MKEYWLNIYQYPNGKIWTGMIAYYRIASFSMGEQAVANGSKLLYRIHVRMK